MYARLDKYNAFGISVSASHDLTLQNKSYEEVSQWNEKEMMEMSWYLLVVVTQSLRGGSPAHRPICNLAIDCTRAMLEFYMSAPYKSHNAAPVSYMQNAVHLFHSFKDVFLLRRDGKKAKARANALTPELMTKRMVDKETNDDTWTPSKKRAEMNASQDYISHKIEISKELDADFHFAKIHLMSHWAEMIRQYVVLQQYYTKRHEQAHKTNLKDDWNASNNNLNYLPQVITFQRHILCFKIRELNLQALVQRSGNSAASCQVFPSGADLGAPLSSQSYVKPKFLRPQNCCDGKHPDAMIKDFRGSSTISKTQRTALH
jgi:hypothetical protein